MNTPQFKNIQNFWVAGINYKKTDACIRGKFAINHDQYEVLLNKAAERGLDELFVISTCNRTEIYGFADAGTQFCELACEVTEGNMAHFIDAAYILKGMDAVRHLFSVGAGLDSQILGDYEIVGQIKNSVRFAKERGFVGAFTERLINCVLQASKMIKNQTELSGGTVSVSFSAVQFLRSRIQDCSSKNIVLLGTGKIGRNTCRNLVDYLCTRNITIINRSEDKAIELASELGLKHTSLHHLSSALENAEVVLVATNSPEPVITAADLSNRSKPVLVLDLSIPFNVAPEAGSLAMVELVNVDQLSRLKDETLRMREAEVPKAISIIHEVLLEFNEWVDMRQHVPLLRDLKSKLRELHLHPTCNPASIISCQKTLDTQIQRVLNDTAGKIKIRNERGCQYIQALREFISLHN